MAINIQKFDKKYIKSDLEDILRIRKILNEHNLDMLIWDIYCLWLNYSDRASANWLSLPKDDNKLYDVLIGEIVK